MGDRMTAERLAEIEQRSEVFELDTRTWSDRDELLQALKAEYAMVKRLLSINIQLRERLEAVLNTEIDWYDEPLFVRQLGAVEKTLAALQEQEDGN